MKVAIITATLDERGGWGRYSRAVVEQLMAQGVEVEVFSIEKPEGFSGVWRQLCPVSSAPILSFFKNIFVVRREFNADVIHALDVWPFGVYGYFTCLGRKIPLFLNGVGTYSVAPFYSAKTKWLVRLACRRAVKIFCISQFVVDRMSAAGVARKKLMVVHMGTNYLPTPTPEEVAQCRRRFTLDEQAYPIVLTVGAVKERKGQLETLKAVEVLKQRYPHVLYLAAGSADFGYGRELTIYAQAHGLRDNFRLVSNADDRTLACFYSLCTVFALNSNTDERAHHFEGFGLVIVEAAQFGKPAVGSCDSGIEDAIKDGETGLLTLQHNPADIAQKIELVLQNIAFFSQNAKAWQENFDWAKAVSVYIKFYTIA